MTTPPEFHTEAITKLLEDIGKDFNEMNAEIVATIEQAAIRRIKISDRIPAIVKEAEDVGNALKVLNIGELNEDFNMLCEQVRLLFAQIRSVRKKTSMLLIPVLRFVD